MTWWEQLCADWARERAASAAYRIQRRAADRARLFTSSTSHELDTEPQSEPNGSQKGALA